MRYLWYVMLCAAACVIAGAGCTSTAPTPKTRTIADPPLGRFIACPAGWNDVTEKALSPDVEYWLLSEDRSASLQLKELQISSSAAAHTAAEPIATLAHISLRLKLAAAGKNFQVTQAPALFNNNPQFGVYSYSEKGLLRRVLVFRKRSRLYELELAQEMDVQAFAQYMPAQIAFAMNVLGK